MQRDDTAPQISTGARAISALIDIEVALDQWSEESAGDRLDEIRAALNRAFDGMENFDDRSKAAANQIACAAQNLKNPEPAVINALDDAFESITDTELVPRHVRFG